MKWPPEKILVPVDFSDFSLTAVDAALQIATAPSQVHVLHVLADLEASEPGMMWGTIDQASRAKQAEESLRQVISAEPGREGVTTEIVFGDPGHRIAECADRIGADLVVMPSHGRRGLARVLIGSVTERSLRLAHCPVLVLRQPKKA